MKDDEVVLKIRELLDSNSFVYEYFEHSETLTSDDAVKVRGTTPHMGAKALIFKGFKTGKNFMVVLPGDLRVDSKKIRNILKEDIGFEDPKIILEKFGIIVGGVPPFWDILRKGDSNTINGFIDKRLFENEKIAFNCGKRTVSIVMRSEDYMKVIGDNIIGDYTKI